jgi:hypothetical protein
MIPIAGIIQGHNRTQINLFPVSLDQSIDTDNEVRMISSLFLAIFDSIRSISEVCDGILFPGNRDVLHKFVYEGIFATK